MPDKQAKEDLRDKLILERELRIEIDKVNRAIVRETAKKYGISGDTLDSEEFRQKIEEILNEHYAKTADVFDKKMQGKLPKDLEITDDEKAAIAAALAIFFLARSGDQSQIITDTNQRDINLSVLSAQNIAQEEALEGRVLSQMEIGVLAGAALSRKLAGRAGTIASFETQTAAETAKGTETEVLIGQDPSVQAGSPKKTTATKQWVTMRDELVRAKHRAADTSTVEINKPFTVGGELLRWPGDRSLGASLNNVINCRCSAVYDPESVITVRNETGEVLDLI